MSDIVARKYYDEVAAERDALQNHVNALQAEIDKGRDWNRLLELQLGNLKSLYDELNEAVVGYLEMRIAYEDLLPHLRLKDEKTAPNSDRICHNVGNPPCRTCSE